MEELFFQGRKFVIGRNCRENILLFKVHMHLNVLVGCVYEQKIGNGMQIWLLSLQKY